MQKKKGQYFCFSLSNSAILNACAEDIWLKNGLQAWTGRSNVCNARNIPRTPHRREGSMSSADSFVLRCISLARVTSLWQDTVLGMPLPGYRSAQRTPRTLSLSSPTLAVQAAACLSRHTVVPVHLLSLSCSDDESCHDAVPCASWCIL